MWDNKSNGLLHLSKLTNQPIEQDDTHLISSNLPIGSYDQVNKLSTPGSFQTRSRCRKLVHPNTPSGPQVILYGVRSRSHFFPLLSFPSKEWCSKISQRVEKWTSFGIKFYWWNSTSTLWFSKGDTKISTVPRTDNQHFFAKYYLFYKTKFRNFNFHFSNFQQLKNKNEKYTLSCVFVIVTQWLGK